MPFLNQVVVSSLPCSTGEMSLEKVGASKPCSHLLLAMLVILLLPRRPVIT